MSEVKLILGDCLEVMKSIPDKSVDIVFTSPPFKDDYAPDEYYKFYGLWFSHMKRIANRVLCIIHTVTKINHLVKNYPPKRILVWGKGISQCSYRWNPILIYQISDNYKVNKYIWADAFGIESITGKWKVHKYQDPLLLYTTIIGMFKNCKNLLDPFMGSGTTGCACLELGLDYIGVEFSKDSFTVAKNRINKFAKEMEN